MTSAGDQLSPPHTQWCEGKQECVRRWELEADLQPGETFETVCDVPHKVTIDPGFVPVDRDLPSTLPAAPDLLSLHSVSPAAAGLVNTVLPTHFLPVPLPCTAHPNNPTNQKVETKEVVCRVPRSGTMTSTSFFLGPTLTSLASATPYR